jgi:hypothetical protein
LWRDGLEGPPQPFVALRRGWRHCSANEGVEEISVVQMVFVHGVATRSSDAYNQEEKTSVGSALDTVQGRASG